MDESISVVSWSLILYPISWLVCLLYLCLFFSLVCMRLKLNLINGLYALDFCTSAVFMVIEVEHDKIDDDKVVVLYSNHYVLPSSMVNLTGQHGGCRPDLVKITFKVKYVFSVTFSVSNPCDR